MQPEQKEGAPLTPAIVFENLQAHQRTAALLGIDGLQRVVRSRSAFAAEADRSGLR